MTTETAGQTTGPLQRLRRVHELAVLNELRMHGPLTRQELGTATGLSRTTLYDIVVALLADGVVTETRMPGPPRRGRPQSVIALAPGSASVAGVEIGRSHVGVAVANFAHEVVVGADRPLEPGLSDEELAAFAVRCLKEALESAEVNRTRLSGIVVGVPLSLDVTSTLTHDRRDLLAAAFADEFGVPPVFDNNARLVALAEAQWGAGENADDLVYVHLDAGVGGGLVMRGQLVNGLTGHGGELGHMSVDANGPACWCGGRGCLERYVALPEVLAAAGVESIDGLSSPRARPSLDAAVDRLAQAIAGLVTALDLRLVVIGGALVQVPGLAELVQDRVRALAPAHVAAGLEVRRAQLGSLGSARGGVVLALRDSRLLAEYTL